MWCFSHICILFYYFKSYILCDELGTQAFASGICIEPYNPYAAGLLANLLYLQKILNDGIGIAATYVETMLIESRFTCY